MTPPATSGRLQIALLCWSFAARWSSICHRIWVGRANGWTETLLQPASYNSNTVRDRPYVSVWIGKLIAIHSRAIEYRPIPDTGIPNPKAGGRKVRSPPFKFQPAGWRLTKMSIEHILGYIGCLWSGAMNNRTAFSKAPNDWKQIPLWWWPCVSFESYLGILSRLLLNWFWS